MRVPPAVIIAFISIVALPSFAQSKGDWNAVQTIDRGRLITLKTRQKIRCEFVDATDDKLFCDQERPFRSSDRLVIDRSAIREVRLELTDESNAMVNACIGGVVGLGVGAIHTASNNGTDGRPLMMMIGAMIGGTGFRHAHLVHGRVVYRR